MEPTRVFKVALEEPVTDPKRGVMKEEGKMCLFSSSSLYTFAFPVDWRIETTSEILLYAASQR